jgi:hypothetical protein
MKKTHIIIILLFLSLTYSTLFFIEIEKTVLYNKDDVQLYIEKADNKFLSFNSIMFNSEVKNHYYPEPVNIKNVKNAEW